MITIQTVLEILKADHNFREMSLAGCYHYEAKSDKVFTKVSYDSRDIDKDTLFFVKGATFKKDYLADAIANGLGYYIAEKDYELAATAIIVNDVRRAMSLIAQHFYGNPQERLKIIAFTGTKGKTTAAYFAYNILKENHKPAMLSTMSTTLDGKTFFKSQLTTPESLDLYRMMAQALDNKMTHLIMEVSSQAYLMNRIYGLSFDVGVFLNISPDHIGPIEHPTFEDYFYHKRLLMTNSKAVVVNSDMAHFQVVKEQVASKTHLFYGQNSQNRIENSEAFSFDVKGLLAGHYSIRLIGHFNQENALATALACHLLGVSQEDSLAGIQKTQVPGRMEVLTQSNGAKVFVDYAHNGDSLEKLLSVIEPHHSGQVTLILGAPGNKGESRRRDFGDVINKHKDLSIILSADDPNFEDPLAICQEIQHYIKRPVDIIVDRDEAIKTALSRTQSNQDAVIIAGKGADAFQIVKGVRTDYPGDRAIAERYL
ncbi:UDP-N-acetylmuramoyl-L-alanyl-D-glutamate--L-lysine ligase [Streptococcus sp. zg-JUN1979]|uniref:UDP-N-acetylmuramoyl-L-alanyl-D-glutamate--L- lysine ligase n=1 Tax=Streptococcus sp. zg-JUN1979 TaxID=3391450 RepID=UPI0039A736AB